jgi:hypothetical protein
MAQQINLFNPIFRPQRMTLLSATVLSIVLGLMALAGGAAFAVVRQEGNALKARVDAGAARLEAAQAEAKKLAAEIAAQKKDVNLEAEVARLETLAGQRRDSMAVLKGGVLGNTTGFAEYFRAFARQTVSGLWLTGFTVSGGGADVSVAGRMLDAEILPQYLGRLKREAVFNGRAFSGLRIGQPGVDPAAAARAADAKGGPSATAMPAFLEFALSSPGDVQAASDAAALGGQRR